MSIRRLVAFLVLALDAYIILRVAPELGMLGPVFQLIGALVGIGALGVLVFNLPLARRHRTERQDSRSSDIHSDNKPSHRVAGLVGVLLFVIAPLFIAARGVYLGVLPSFLRPRSPEISFSETPGLFALNLLAYTVWGSAFLFMVLRGRRAKRESQRSIGVASGDRKV